MNRRVLLAGVTAAVGAAVIAGFLALGTPREERRRRLDEARVADLQALRSAIAEHHERTRALPARLEDLAGGGPKPAGLADPGSGGSYTYLVHDDSTFELCATFDAASEEGRPRLPIDPWFHDAGLDCYRFRIGHVRPRELAPLPEEPPDAGP